MAANRPRTRKTPPARTVAAGGSDRGATPPLAEGWIYGVHSVREALRAHRRELQRIVVRAGRRRPDIEEIEGLAIERGLRVEHVDQPEIDRALGLTLGSDVQTQGVALRAGRLPEYSVRSLLDGLPESSRGRVIVALDGVEDPQNVGAIARVAESCGASGLILTDRRAPDLTATVSRASAGAIEWLPVARVGNLSRALEDLQQAGFWVVAAEPEGKPLFEVEDRLLRGDLVVVLGAEGKGLRPAILKGADHRVALPMLGRVASLNVSTAGAILLYDLLRRSMAESADSA